MSLLILDNYDSFTYNLVHIIRQLGIVHEVHRNDKISAEDTKRFERIILSPGPGIPSEAGNMPSIIAANISTKPLLGICLGHQAIAEHFGAQLENMTRVYHGVNTNIRQCGQPDIFGGIPKEFEAGRYHSWKVSRNGLPDNIEVTAEDDAGDIMAFSIKNSRAFGIQFHPESIMTRDGEQMIKNFLAL